MHSSVTGPARNTYNFWSRTLHFLALANSAVAQAAFDVERAIYRPREADVTYSPHVFVTGLARAGTTILMRLIYGSGEFRSLTYRDMPFVLAPNVWHQICSLSQRHMAPVERSHGDGILIDFDSPEALEEVFWRAKCGADYIRRDRLVPMTVGPEVLSDFRHYIALLLARSPGKRYLSKNNNNLLRLAGLADCFPNASIIIPFREPIQHASSLMRQHVRFQDRQSGDRFEKRYMTWLVHHEFGHDHRPFVFDDSRVAQGAGTQSLAYWLRLWIDVYEYIAANVPERGILLSYDRLCENTDAIWPLLCSRLQLPVQLLAEPLKRSHQPVTENVPPDLLDRAEALHVALCQRAI